MRGMAQQPRSCVDVPTHAGRVAPWNHADSTVLEDDRLPTAALAFASQAGQHLQAGAKRGLPPEVDCNGDVGAVYLVPPALWYKHCVTCLHHSVQWQWENGMS